MKAILGEKLGMSQIFDKEGKPVPVTVIKAGPCYITGIKTQENDGYEAVQLGFGQAKRLTKPEEGRLKKAKIKEKLKYFREFKIEDIEVLKNLKLGEKIDVSVFQEGDKVMVSGISKGKGFAGVIKRHGFSRGPETHGSDHHRRPGSIGSMFPQRVIKGRKMPGHMGAERITIKGLKVAKVLPETDILLIKGAIPGPKKGLIEIRGI
uniref:Large ribosomal subunit protein uL3 n=1 Tax=candidate division CPR3 bacterium TaxID=2268181 RepID=A0A7V3JA09_UNCC3